MAAGSFEVFTHSVIATAALTASRAVTAAGALPAAAARCLGFTKFSGVIGDRVAVAVLGSTVAEAGAAIALGAALELDALGRVITRTAGVTVGSALGTAAAAGDKIEIVLIAN
jgi:hypothetical protein